MFGTIRKHQTWLWAIIITLTIISFVIYFGPQSRVSQGRADRGPAAPSTVNPLLKKIFAMLDRRLSLIISSRAVDRCLMKRAPVNQALT